MFYIDILTVIVALSTVGITTYIILNFDILFIHRQLSDAEINEIVNAEIKAEQEELMNLSLEENYRRLFEDNENDNNNDYEDDNNGHNNGEGCI
jgi:hypothetical protein